MSELVQPLEKAASVKMVGGKADSLGQLIRNRLEVPPGFVVTSEAFQQMTVELKQSILEHFDELRVKTVAVRSSAVAEDGAKDAWAGQLDTFLNINRAGLIENIEKCWQSADSDRAKAYARQKNLKAGPVAVIVQAMVNGQVSGVAFSVHPVTKNPDHVVIEATPGLAEGVVSGTITPDNYVFDKKSGSVVDRTLAGTKTHLSNKQIKNVAVMVQKLESYSGFPVDVEWTFDGQKLFILQSRAITTLG